MLATQHALGWEAWMVRGEVLVTVDPIYEFISKKTFGLHHSQIHKPSKAFDARGCAVNNITTKLHVCLNVSSTGCTTRDGRRAKAEEALMLSFYIHSETTHTNQKHKPNIQTQALSTTTCGSLKQL